jgi:hypothetical protein
MFSFESLDQKTRTLMIQELDYDLARGEIYISPRLVSDGKEMYVKLLREALQTGSPETFATAIERSPLLTSFELRNKNGKVIQVRVPFTAHITLAEGEFNRYYIRGVCLRAIDEGLENLQVYRAKPVRVARSQSEALIGTLVNSQTLLEDLRNSNVSVDNALGVPAGPNSGLSVRFSKN